MAEINQIFNPNEPKIIIEVDKSLIKVDDTVIKLTGDINALSQILAQSGISFEKLAEVQKKTETTTKNLDTVGQQLIVSEKRLKDIQDSRTKTIIKNRNEAQKEAKIIKQNVIINNSLSGSYTKLTNELNKNIAKYKDLSAKQRENTKVGGRLLSTIQKQDMAVKKLDSTMGRSQRHVGNYGGAIKKVALQFAGALGLTSVLYLFVNVLKGSFNTIREFTKQNAVLAGVLGKTRKEITELTDQAIRLGSVYPVTASEVNKLQVSFARLGFTQIEIINLTEATIQGSIALNSELDETATLVGAVVKAYQNLGTTDAGEIIDKLTLSTQLSSLSFSGLETALPKVASAASAMNIDLSTTLTHLGLINDATLDASISGTSLRNIYLELAKRGITLNEALEIINTSSNKLSTSFELFGKRGAIAGLALANAGDRAIEFKNAVDEAGGTAGRVAEEQMATLDGSIKGLSSSWEKFILGFKGSEGFFRSVIDSLSLAIDTFSNDSISSLRKLVELMTLGFVPAASSVQKRLSSVSKNIAKASVRDLEHTIKINGEKLKNGSKTDKLILDMLKNRLQQQKMIDIAAERNAKTRKENADNEAETVALAKAKEQLVIAKEESDKRIEIAQKESDAKRGILEDEVNDFLKMEKAKTKLERKIRHDKLEKEKESTKELDEIELSVSQAKANRDKKNQDEEKAQTKQNAEQFKEDAINQSIELGNFIFSNKRDQLAREYEAAEGNAEKQAEISKKIAQQEKKQALFNIAINTAVAISKVLGQLGIFGLAAWIPIAALGVIQAGIVAATPIPEFAEGTRNTPDRFIAGDKKGGGAARELMQLNSGKLVMVDKPTYFEGNEFKGATIWKNQDTENILSKTKHSGFNGSSMTDTRIVNELQQTRKAIQNMPQVTISNTGNMIAKRTRLKRENYYHNKYGVN